MCLAFLHQPRVKATFKSAIGYFLVKKYFNFHYVCIICVLRCKKSFVKTVAKWILENKCKKCCKIFCEIYFAKYSASFILQNWFCHIFPPRVIFLAFLFIYFWLLFTFLFDLHIPFIFPCFLIHFRVFLRNLLLFTYNFAVFLLIFLHQKRAHSF